MFRFFLWFSTLKKQKKKIENDRIRFERGLKPQKHYLQYSNWIK